MLVSHPVPASRMALGVDVGAPGDSWGGEAGACGIGLGPPGEVLIEWPDGSTRFPLVCVRRLQSHSLSSMLNEMCFGALCRGERRKNNGHSDRIKVYLVLFRNPALSSSWSWCSHNGQSLVLHSDMPKARKTSHPGRKPLKEINT